MAIPTRATISETDNLPGEEIAFRIGNPGWVMHKLSGLYSNVELAVAREYSTNAYDSHVEAGNSNPIQVHLPDVLNPTFVVEDNGIGMSVDDLRETYTSFGDSTKRDNNEVVGMLGFGSKVGMAYTNQFTVTATKDGYTTQALVTKKPDYTPVLKILSHSFTGNDNGVKVSVPVHNIPEFNRKANDFYRFWKPGTVLVNDKEPRQAVGEKIKDNLYYSTERATSYVIMGNVPYRIANPDALFANARLSEMISFVAYVPNGSVDFTPSREDLEYTQRTKDFLQKIVTDFEEDMLKQIHKEISTAENHAQAYGVWKGWRNRLGNSSIVYDATYKGDKISDELEVAGMEYEIDGRRYYGQDDHIKKWSMDSVNRTIFITHYPFEKVTSYNKMKFRQYKGYAKTPARYAVFIAGDFKSPWVPKERIISWEALKAAIPRATPDHTVMGGPRRIPGKFDYWTKDGMFIEKDIPDNSTVFYLSAKDSKEKSIPDALKLLNTVQGTITDKVVVVKLAVNRIDKFKRDNPGTEEFLNWARKRVILDGPSLVTPDEKIVENMTDQAKTWLRSLEIDKIHDPEWKKLAVLIKTSSQMGEYYKHQQLARDLGLWSQFVKFRGNKLDESILQKYPILKHLTYLRTGLAEEMIIYINAAYAARKGQKP